MSKRDGVAVVTRAASVHATYRRPWRWAVVALLVMVTVVGGGRVFADAAQVPADAPGALANEQLDDAHGRPQFKYVVSAQSTLKAVAKSLGVTVDDLALFNPVIQDAISDAGHTDFSCDLSGDTLKGTSTDPARYRDDLVCRETTKTELYDSTVLAEGTELIVPIDFPLHPDMAPLKVDVLENRFVGVYRSPLFYSQIDELVQWYIDELAAFGYELHRKKEDGNGAIRYFSGGVVALGTVEMSPGDEDNPTFIDIALVVESPMIDGSTCVSTGVLGYASTCVDE